MPTRELKKGGLVRVTILKKQRTVFSESGLLYTQIFIFQDFFCLTYAFSQIILKLHRLITGVRFETLLRVARLRA